MMRFCAVLACLLLAACGFTPLYAPQTQPALRSVVIETTGEARDSQHLRLLLVDRFYGSGAAVSPAWRLKVSYTSSRESLGIQADDTATRARLTMQAQFELTPLAGGTSYKGQERSLVSYDIQTDPYATDAAEQSAQDRGLVQLADLITNRVAVRVSPHTP